MDVWFYSFIQSTGDEMVCDWWAWRTPGFSLSLHKMSLEGAVCIEAMDAFPRYFGAHIEPLGRHACSFADTGRVGTQLAADNKGSERRGGGQGRTGKGEHHRSVLLKNTFIYYCYLFLAMPCGMWDLSSLIRGQTLHPLQWKLRVLTAGPPRKLLGMCSDTKSSGTILDFTIISVVIVSPWWLAQTYEFY